MRVDRVVSIAMCTHEGERFVQEQLDSIAAQTRSPDELIICDDASTDETVPILRRFASRAPFPVRVHLNEERLGTVKNFEQAIALTGGDVLFLSDQDDVWHPDKLSRLLAAMTASGAGAVFCDAEVADERLTSLGYGLWESRAVGFTRRRRRLLASGRAMNVMIRNNVVAGMTLGFLARYKELILPIPPQWDHDAWVSLVLAAVTEMAMVPERLVTYRQHEGQQAHVDAVQRIRKLPFRDKLPETNPGVYLCSADILGLAHDRLTAKAGVFPPRDRTLAAVEGKMRHLRARAEMRAGRNRRRLVLRELVSGNYRRYSRGWKEVLRDLIA